MSVAIRNEKTAQRRLERGGTCPGADLRVEAGNVYDMGETETEGSVRVQVLLTSVQERTSHGRTYVQETQDYAALG